MTPQSEGYIPLSQVVDFIDMAGIYEIKCLAKERYYIGQSNSIAHRASCHFQDLKNGRHNNRTMQYDWDSVNDPNSFVFKVITKMEHHDRVGLLKEEGKEINRRRKYGIVLYNDLITLTVGADDSLTVRQVAKRPEPQQQKETAAPNEPDNKPYVRPAERYIPLNQGTCFECGMIAEINDKLFRCDDREIRCERCVDIRSEKMAEQMRAARKENSGMWQNTRTTSKKRMRWQMMLNSPANDLVSAVAHYVQKYGQYPTEAQFNPDCTLPNSEDIKITHHRFVPSGYADFPTPDQE